MYRLLRSNLEGDDRGKPILVRPFLANRRLVERVMELMFNMDLRVVDKGGSCGLMTFSVSFFLMLLLLLLLWKVFSRGVIGLPVIFVSFVCFVDVVSGEY